LTVHSLLKLVSALRTSARISVRDASFLYEVDLYGGVPRRATRTSVDGSFQRGERVLAALLGVGAGRFVVAPLSPGSLAFAEGDLTGTLEAQLSTPIAFARMALDATTGANTMHVQRIVLDGDMVDGYLLATPEPSRALVRRLVAGDSPRDLLLRGDVAPSLIEDVLADLAARGAIVAVHSYGGEDLFRAAVERGVDSRDANANVEGADPGRRIPSAPPTSDLVARELPVVKEAATRRFRASPVNDSDVSPSDDSAPPSSLEDAVMRAMSERSPSSPRPPSAEQPPIVEPSQLRPRSSNPPAVAPTSSPSSVSPDAIVPASSGETLTAPEDSKTEPAQLDGDGVAGGTDSISSSASNDLSSSEAALDPTAVSAGPGQTSKLGLIVAVVLVLGVALVVGGMRWRAPGGDTLGAETVSSEGSTPLGATHGVTYVDIPGTVSVPAGQGLLDVASPAGHAIRVDGAEPANPSEDGRVLLPAVAGRHVISVGGAGEERSRFVLVRAGQAARVDFDEP
jgi:hypothetical protein